MIAFGMPYLLETPVIEDAARLCAELGLSFVELNMNFPACQAQRLDPQLLYHLRREYGIFFTLHLPEEFDPFTFAEPVRRAWMDVLQDALTLDGSGLLNNQAAGDFPTLPPGTSMVSWYPFEEDDNPGDVTKIVISPRWRCR